MMPFGPMFKKHIGPVRPGDCPCAMPKRKASSLKVQRSRGMNAWPQLRSLSYLQLL